MTVVCVGIAVQDIVFAVDVHPTEPGKYRAAGRRLIGGGVAANAAVTVAALGGSSALLSSVGDDSTGELIVGGLREAGVDVAGIRRVPGAQSPLSAVLVDREGERLVVNHASDGLFDLAAPVTPAEVADATVVLADMRWPAGAVAALGEARARGVPGVVDCDHDPSVNDGERILELASHVIFSWPTLARWTDTTEPGPALRVAAARIAGWVAATDGAAGTYWLDGDEVRHLAALEVEVVDTLGAGDVFHGAFALALDEGRSVDESLWFANGAAALKCTRPGGRAGIPTRAEVDEFLASGPVLRGAQ